MQNCLGRVVAVVLLSGWILSASGQLIYQRLKSVPFGDNPDITVGTNPKGVLIEGLDGMLYGTMSQGGGTNYFPVPAATNGAVCRVNKDGTGYTVLWKFINLNEGASPWGGLVQASDGSFFGTTAYGGSSNLGTVFNLAKISSGYTNKILRNFAGTNGSNPQAGLLLAADGALYGTTFSGGISNKGVVFKLNQDGSGFAVLTNFTGTGGNGANPQAGLIQATNGLLYGTTVGGGSNSAGTIFRLATNGTGYTVLRGLGGNATEAANPLGSLMQGIDGALYGTTTNGGSFAVGAVFKLNLDGSGYARIKNFGDPAFNPDGTRPQGSLVTGNDGLLYGTTYSGGASNEGTIFRLASNGTSYTVVHSFISGPSVQFGEDTNDGANPAAGLMLGRDGGFYGTTFQGGQKLTGTIFSMGPRPTNDAFTNRIPLTDGSAVGTGNNLNATLETGELTHTNLFWASNSVWWSWSGLSNGLVTIVNNSASLNAIIDVYTNRTDTTGACASPPSGLVNWWPGASNAVDVVGGKNGVASNSLSYAAGEVGTAFSFNGVNDRVTIGATNIQPPWTAEFWVNRQNCLTNSAVLLGDTNTALKLEQYPSGRQVGFTIWNVQDYAFNYVAPVSTWVHLVFVGSTSNLQLYVNGSLQGTTNVTMALPRGQIGDDILGRYARQTRGLVDEVSLYNRVLTQSEIQALFNAGSAGKCVTPAYVNLANLTNIASNSSTQYLGSPNRVSFTAQAGATYQVAVSGITNDSVGPNFAGSGDIALSLRTLDLKMLSVIPTTNGASETLFTATAQIGNARGIAPGPLRIELLARAGFSTAASSNANVFLLPDQVVGTYVLANPNTVAPGITTNITLTGKCPAPTNYVVGGTSNFIGWGVFALLEEQAGTNWLFKDSDLVLYGVWPEAGGFGGPGGGVIRINPATGGGSFNPVQLTNVTIVGPAGVNEGTTNSYYGTARFDDGSAPVNFTNTTWLSSLFTITTNGSFQAGSVTNDTPVQLTVYYFYDKTNTASRSVIVTNLPPPVLNSLVRLANKQFQFTLSGVPGRKHVIEAATNISSPVTWTNLATNTTSSGGSWIYTDNGATNLSRRFYRGRETQ